MKLFKYRQPVAKGRMNEYAEGPIEVKVYVMWEEERPSKKAHTGACSLGEKWGAHQYS